MPTLEEVEVEMDEEESFLSQVWEKLCSPDCSLLVLKLFNMLSNAKQVESAILGQLEDATINATVVPQAYVDVMDKGNLQTDMEEGNYSSIDMSFKEQSFQSMYWTVRERNAEEHKKLLAMANKPVDQNYLSYDCKVCHNISNIDILEMVHLFRPVICPLTNWVMHMDQTGYLWPCSGCTHSGI